MAACLLLLAASGAAAVNFRSPGPVEFFTEVDLNGENVTDADFRSSSSNINFYAAGSKSLSIMSSGRLEVPGGPLDLAGNRILNADLGVGPGGIEFISGGDTVFSVESSGEVKVRDGPPNLSGNQMVNVRKPSSEDDDAVATVGYVKDQTGGSGTLGKVPVTAKWEEDAFDGSGYAASFTNAEATGGGLKLDPYSGPKDGVYFWERFVDDGVAGTPYQTYTVVSLDLTDIDAVNWSAWTDNPGTSDDDAKVRVYDQDLSRTVVVESGDGGDIPDTSYTEYDVSGRSGTADFALQYETNTNFDGADLDFNVTYKFPENQGTVELTPLGPEKRKMTSYASASWFNKTTPGSSSAEVDIIYENGTVFKSDIIRSESISSVPRSDNFSFRTRFDTPSALDKPELDLLAFNGVM